MSQTKKATLAALIGTAVMASVFAVAANIGLGTTQLGAGGTGVSSCDSAITSSYNTAYSAGSATPAVDAGYKVSSVDISGVDDACDGQSFKIQFTTAGQAIEGLELTGTWPTGAATSNNVLATAADVDADQVDGVYITFHGAPPAPPAP